MKKGWLLFITVFIATVLVGSIPAPKKASASFVANNLIADGAFDFATSMNASQIDAFLNSFSNSCISMVSGFDARLPSGYSPSGGFTYGGFGTAGQVIETAALVYNLNPQVLLVTLEKEQSLVTGRNNFAGYCNNGDEHKYAAAVGYGCPDSGTTYSYSGISLYRRNGVERTNTGTTCVNSASKAGFSQQVIRAAWLLKFGQQRSKGNTNWAVIQGNWDNSDDPLTCYGGPMTQGNFKRCSSDSSPTFYDGWITIDGLATHMDTGGTAALYWYTPHFHGNQNFVSLFEQWFGSTQSPSTCTGTETPGAAVSRFYHPRTFEHFYTAYGCDISFLLKLGYVYEGPVFGNTNSTDPSAVPVYRLYNPTTKHHFWTTTNETPEQLAAGGTGYKQEAGIVFYVSSYGTSGVQPISRLYNPKTYLHIWVTEPGPNGLAMLSKAGYSQPEGPVFYAK